MTINVTVNRSPDGSPDGTATISATNPDKISVGAGYGQTQKVEFTEQLDHVASALGYGLEQIRQAKANEDPEG